MLKSFITGSLYLFEKTRSCSVIWCKTLFLVWGHSKSTFAQEGGSTKSEQKRTAGGGGGGFHWVRSLFQKIVWPILFMLAIFSPLLHSFSSFL